MRAEKRAHAKVKATKQAVERAKAAATAAAAAAAAAAAEFSHANEYSRFITAITCWQNTIEDVAKRAGYRNISMSPDVVALVGAEKQQTPHVDLALRVGQMQVILTLTPNAEPTCGVC